MKTERITKKERKKISNVARQMLRTAGTIKEFSVEYRLINGIGIDGEPKVTEVVFFQLQGLDGLSYIKGMSGYEVARRGSAKQLAKFILAELRAVGFGKDALYSRNFGERS